MHTDLTHAPWRKSTYSGDSSCVELAPLDGGIVGLRDSKDPGAGALLFTPAEIAAFIEGAKAGEFDDLAR